MIPTLVPQLAFRDQHQLISRRGLLLSRRAKRDVAHSRFVNVGKTPNHVKAGLDARALVKILKRDAIVIKKAVRMGGYVHNIRWKMIRIQRWKGLPVSNRPKVSKNFPKGCRMPICNPASGEGRSFRSSSAKASRHVKASRARSAINSLKRGATIIKDAVTSRGIISKMFNKDRIRHWTKILVPQAEIKELTVPVAQWSATDLHPPFYQDGLVTSAFLPTVWEGNDSYVQAACSPPQVILLDQDAEMGDSSEGRAEMETDDKNIVMKNGPFRDLLAEAEFFLRDIRREFLNTNIIMRDGGRDHLNTDVIMRDGTQYFLDDDVIMRDGTRDFLDDDVVMRDDPKDFLDADVVMRDGTQDYLDNDDIMRDGTQDFLDNDIVMRDGTRDFLDVDALLDNVALDDTEDNLHLAFHPYSSTDYSPTSSTATLVDEDIVMADPGGYKKPISIDCLTAMFAAMDPNTGASL
ncbi:hypothetical protein NP233_g8615 [Leucocoprinus birnbaumii]|uniref:Uncharacterized protein n=1 Tax=Leucocoprinus birnbaumii TaxID=56174 RepID=A0AAD5VM14_9AGAR|nr:hypothetical protein NP233_g8615 [Leucocoprinus birnbaumii]